MRVLIVGHVRPCHEKLHADGHKTVLFMPQDRILPKDLSSPHDAVIALEASASSEQWSDIATAMHKAQPFDAVVCYSDLYQHTAYEIAWRLNVFCVIDKDLLEKTRNKFLMQQALDSHNIPHCHYRFARGKEEIVQAVREIGMPCILKPVAGEASMGVAKLNGEGDLEHALDWVGENDIKLGVMVEEFLVGQEFSVEAISDAGRHHIIAVTKKYKDMTSFVEIGHVVPAPIDMDAKEAIEAYVRQVLTGLGFRNAPSHTEVIVTDKGPRIVETHTRLGGDRIIDLVEHACGISLYALSAKQSVGTSLAELIPPEIAYAQSAAIWYADPSMPGDLYLENIAGIDDASAMENVKLVEALKKNGSPGATVKHSHDRSALAIAVGKSGEEALMASQHAIRKLDFLYRWKSPAGGCGSLQVEAP
jgi:biotin carboxylase